jgi:transposase
VTGLEEIVMILDLHRQGAGVSAIARRTGLDRKTVRKVIAGGRQPPSAQSDAAAAVRAVSA